MEGKKTLKKYHVAVANIMLDTEVSDSAFLSSVSRWQLDCCEGVHYR